MLPDGFLRAICDSPDDDTPRLVFADWLEENGEADYSAFIRVQIELARTYHNPEAEAAGCKCSTCEKVRPLRRRERELLREHYNAWVGPALVALGVTNAARLTTFNALDSRFGHESFRRGFVAAVTLTCESFLARAAALFRVAPVEQVTLSDAGPFMRCWHRQNGGVRLSWQLPGPVFCRLAGGRLAYPRAHRRRYADDAEALADAGRAAVAYGRHAARAAARRPGAVSGTPPS